MEIKKFTDIEPTRFDSDAVKGVAGRVLIGKADGAENFCMRLFELSKGGFSPRHTHDWEHEIFIYSGQGAVFRNGDWIPLESGCAVFIPGNEEHQMKNTGDEPFRFICIIPAGPPEL
ncbi:MAG: cupin domain-containing protein [Deltaproteobacteria bacterium]|nr:cupin domain-containing protein [Deltaproteobacteria bacterium]